MASKSPRRVLLDVLLLGPAGTGESHLVQALGYRAIKGGFTVLYRLVFDVVRHFLSDEALGGDEKVLTRYLKLDLITVDDMGLEPCPNGRASTSSRSSCGATRIAPP